MNLTRVMPTQGEQKRGKVYVPIWTKTVCFSVLKSKPFLYGERVKVMSMVTINGESINADHLLLIDFLLQNGYSPQQIAIEINGEIVPKSQYSVKKLQPGDAVEIVRFVGGG